jgi:hypothetical protein
MEDVSGHGVTGFLKDGFFMSRLLNASVLPVSFVLSPARAGTAAPTTVSPPAVESLNLPPTPEAQLPAPEDIFQDKYAPNQAGSPVYVHPTSFEADVFANVKPEKTQGLKKPPRLRDNIEFQKRQEESNPLVNCLPVRLIGGYSNETYESVVEPVAAIMGALNVHKLDKQDPEFLNTSTKVVDAVQEGTMVKGDPAFKRYAQRGMLSETQVGSLELFEKLSYGVVGTYVAADAGYHGYRGYKATKEQTGNNSYALARGAQLAGGQGIFQFLASYMIPAKFIKDIIYVQTKNLTTALPNAVLGSLAIKPEREAHMSPHMAEGAAKTIVETSEKISDLVGNVTTPLLGRLGNTFNSDVLLDGVRKHFNPGDANIARNAIKNPKLAMGLNVGSSIIAGGVALASIPVCAKYLDPLFEKVVHELYYRPTNALLAKFYPQAYRQQLAQFEAEQPPEERSLTDAELETFLPHVFEKARRKSATGVEPNVVPTPAPVALPAG